MNSVHILSSVSTEDDAFIIQKLWKKIHFQNSYACHGFWTADISNPIFILLYKAWNFVNQTMLEILEQITILYSLFMFNMKKSLFSSKNAVVHFWSRFISLFFGEIANTLRNFSPSFRKQFYYLVCSLSSLPNYFS